MLSQVEERCEGWVERTDWYSQCLLIEADECLDPLLYCVCNGGMHLYKHTAEHIRSRYAFPLSHSFNVKNTTADFYKVEG